MGLASALSTALTGLSAAETSIDVAGNNLANSQTVGFKESNAVFATQFLQTLSLGAGPTEDRGGTNPRQYGLGTQVAEITPNFTQGTIEISSNPSDLAVQGDGFFIVQSDSAGEQLYTRTGIFKTNADNELVTPTGHRLLGYTVDDLFEVQRTTLQPITIPLGSAAVAQATENVFFEGTLSPTGDVATKAEILQTGILGDSALSYPDPTTVADPSPPTPTLPGTFSSAAATTGGSIGDGSYAYRVVFSDRSTADAGVQGETRWVDVGPIAVDNSGAGEDSISLTDLPGADGPYTHVRVYRTQDLGANPGSDYYLVHEEAAVGGTFNFTDGTSDAALVGNAEFNDTLLSGAYDYHVVFSDADGGPPNGAESRPSERIESVTVSNGRILLDNLPTPPADSNWTTIRIYRSLQSNDEDFHFVGEIPAGENQIFTDSFTDAEIQGNAVLDFDGPRITSGTLLVNVQSRNGSVYENPFEEGTLTFAARKGGRTLEAQEFEITSSSTVAELLSFMEGAMGLQSSSSGAVNPIPPSETATGTLPPGASVTSDGRIQFVGNNGEDNAIDIRLDALQLTVDGATQNVDVPFASVQQAVGESASSDFIVYDTLGIPLRVRVTAVLESRTNTTTTYRWFADSPDNQPLEGNDISVGTGLITFDSEGNVLPVSGNTVNIDRQGVSSASPLSFDLDLSQLSGLSVPQSNLAATRQDGSAAGTLSSFIIGEDGLVRGVFSNGVTRDLGEIVLASFANPSGLEQRGENLYSSGVNSGLPVQGTPGTQGIGTILAGSVELSNTDVGSNLIDLILASSQYRGNTRVINTAQQLLDELLNLRR